MWQLTMYCHRMSPDAMPLLTQNVLRPQTPQTQFRWLHLHSLCGATLFGSHQSHLFPPVWNRLVGFVFRVQRVGSTMQNLRKVDENSDLILSRL